ncbi:MAG: hypothetical protein AAFQ43_01350, partial [Bacteroidota bacterium]
MRPRLVVFVFLAVLSPAPEAQDGDLLGVPLGTFYDTGGEFFADILALQDGRVLVGSRVLSSEGVLVDTMARGLPLTQLRDGCILFSEGRAALVFLPDGTTLGKFGPVPGAPGAIRQGIIDAVELADGRVLLLQWYQEEDGDEAGRLFAFAADGTPLGLFTADEDDAYLFYPEAVTQLPDGRVIVAEAQNPIFPGPIPRG